MNSMKSENPAGATSNPLALTGFPGRLPGVAGAAPAGSAGASAEDRPRPVPIPGRHLLSIGDLGAEELRGLVEAAVGAARGAWPAAGLLAGRVVGIYFQKSSTRTRTAFTVGAMKLGASTVSYGPHDLQVVTGETLADTGRVLGNYLDVLVVRTNEPVAEMRELAAATRLPIVNAMSAEEHPTQAIADLAALQEAFGTLARVHLLFIGEGNNTAASLALAVAKTPGMRLTLVTPAGYGLPEGVLAEAQRLAWAGGATVTQHHDMQALPRGVDAVYTTRWLTMGVPKGGDWLHSFRPYTVTPEVMTRVSKPDGTVFLHDLPAMRGYEVVDEVLDGPQSIAWRQAFHKMTGAMAVLAWCAGAGGC